MLGFAGRLDDPRKNAELLFQALARLVELGENVELRVTGHKTGNLGRLISTYKLERHITFVGQLNFNELRSFYQSLSLFIIPSHQEGLGIVGIEALACGVPVVSTKCGGPQAYIRPGENGLLCDFDRDDMVAKISGILKNQKTYNELSSSARASIMETYSLTGFHQALEQEWENTWHEHLSPIQ